MNNQVQIQNLSRYKEISNNYKVNLIAALGVLMISIFNDLLFRESYFGHNALFASLCMLIILIVVLILANFNRLRFIDGQVISISQINNKLEIIYIECNWNKLWFPVEVTITADNHLDVSIYMGKSNNILKVKSKQQGYILHLNLFESNDIKRFVNVIVNASNSSNK